MKKKPAFGFSLVKSLKLFSDYNALIFSVLSGNSVIREYFSCFSLKDFVESGNLLYMRKLLKQKWPKKTIVFFGHFHTAKIHIVFIPTIIFHKYFSILFPFLSIGYDFRTKIPLFLYKAYFLLFSLKKMTKKNDRFFWSLYRN